MGVWSLCSQEGDLRLIRKTLPGTSLAVQWLRLCASTAGGMGSIPGWGTKIPHAAQYGQKEKRKKKRLCLKCQLCVCVCVCVCVCGGGGYLWKWLSWVELRKGGALLAVLEHQSAE